MIRPFRLPAIIVAALVFTPDYPAASPREALPSVVSVLPVWPGRAQGGAGAPPGTAPEGSGVVLRGDGIIATAWHVIEPAERTDVRLEDGRVLPARLVGHDAASDIALLRVDAQLTAVEIAPAPDLAAPVCAIGNAFGLGLSITCGVVSAVGVTEAGFNAVEDFVQTDAAANPGTSGGALVDGEGRLVGMVSAIFASGADGNLGVNFAVSAPLLTRVADALIDAGDVDYVSAGWRLARAGRTQLAEIAGAVIADLEAGGPAERAGLARGDVVLAIGARRIRKPRDAVAALALISPGDGSVDVTVRRDGADRTVPLDFGDAPAGDDDDAESGPAGDCPHPAPVCLARQAVFPVSSFDPVGSATRIGPSLLVTSRHVVADRTDAVVLTPDGPRDGVVLPSAYEGDLALIEVEGLPGESLVLSLDSGEAAADAQLYAVGADVARQEVRVFAPGDLIAPPADGAPLGRLHVTARMQPGVSGGALLDEDGDLVGIAAGGGEGRFEAIPVEDVRALLTLRDDPDAAAVQSRLGTALAACAGALDRFQGAQGASAILDRIADTCVAANNQGQFLDAGRALGRAGDFARAVELHALAVSQTPNSINARISLLVSLQLAGRFDEMTAHARWLMTAAPDDPNALRFAIQSGVWGGAPALAEEAYRALLEADPRQAEAARRFIDNAPPAPPRR